MIGRWGKAAAALVLASAVVADLGLAAAVLDRAGDDLPAAWRMLAELAGPQSRVALAGRQAILGGAVAGATAAAVALFAGSAAAALSGGARTMLIALLRLPALCAVALGVLAAAMVLAASGPAAAGLVAFAVASGPIGPRWTLAVVLLPLAVAIVEPAARRLDRTGFESLATLGFGPVRRLIASALPGVLPAAIWAAAAGLLIAATVLFVVAWPVAARQAQITTLAATVAVHPMAALAFCAALVLTGLSVWPSRTP